jgi:hypothetical protein
MASNSSIEDTHFIYQFIEVECLLSRTFDYYICHPPEKLCWILGDEAIRSAVSRHFDDLDGRLGI